MLINNTSDEELGLPELQKMTITGMLLGTDFGRNGKVLELAIETEEFEQYIISLNKKGKELLDLLYANVTVQGIVLGIDSEGNEIIQVNEYSINDRLDTDSDHEFRDRIGTG